ncbi:dephospho-CoA kinase [Anaerolineaceae bacterium oral taxon 439]|nr:dephospho-CoA kinase [Anaerolineaceae bacterium oral taxon 439]
MRIGITGGIAAGKSAVLTLLREFGFEVFDADRIAHQAYRKGTPGFLAVVDRFGPEALSAETGEIDRRKLGEIVFRDRSALRDLEIILHPFVQREIEASLADSDRDAAVEAVKLFEAGLAECFDERWLVCVPEEVALERLVRERGFSVDSALARIRAQSDGLALNRSRADWIILGTTGLSELRRAIADRIGGLRKSVSMGDIK